MEYLVINKILSDKQYGFIKGKSTVMQLLKVLDEWSSMLEKGGQIDVIYTDLEKAFDKVHHDILIHKLKTIKINEKVLAGIINFLKQRRQRVKIEDECSDWTPVVSGIPQGSVLGPLLFIIYINDMIEVCQNGSEVYLYADDSKIFRYIKDEKDAISLQNDLCFIVEWINRNILKLNIDKCKVISYGRVTCKYDYEIKNTKLERIDKIKDLGVVFDSRLKFADHIKEKVKKANSILGLIKRNFNNMPCNAGVTLYKSLVRSHLEYAEVVWSPHYKKD